MKCYSILSIQAKQWVQLFLSIKEEGHQKKYVTPYMHAMVYRVPNIIRQYGNFHVKIGNALYFFLDSYLCTSGVKKHNDDAKRNCFSSNRWDAPADIMMTEYMLEVLQEYSREKRAYTKRDSAYWHEGGIEALRAKRRGEAVQRLAIPEG